MPETTRTSSSDAAEDAFIADVLRARQAPVLVRTASGAAAPAEALPEPHEGMSLEEKQALLQDILFQLLTCYYSPKIFALNVASRGFYALLPYLYDRPEEIEGIKTLVTTFKIATLGYEILNAAVFSNVCPSPESIESAAASTDLSSFRTALNWACSYKLSAGTLKTYNPLYRLGAPVASLLESYPYTSFIFAPVSAVLSRVNNTTPTTPAPIQHPTRAYSPGFESQRRENRINHQSTSASPNTIPLPRTTLKRTRSV